MLTSLLVSFASSESSAIDGVLVVLLIIKLTADLGKSFHTLFNYLIYFLSKYGMHM